MLPARRVVTPKEMLCACSGRGKAFPEASIIMTAKLLERGVTFQLRSVEDGRPALAIPLTETQAPAWALPSLVDPGAGLKVVILAVCT